MNGRLILDGVPEQIEDKAANPEKLTPLGEGQTKRLYVTEGVVGLNVSLG